MRILGAKHSVSAVTSGGSRIFRMDWTQGSPQVLDTLGPSGAFTDKDFAKKHHLTVGSPMQVLVPGGERPTFTIKGSSIPPRAARRSHR